MSLLWTLLFGPLVWRLMVCTYVQVVHTCIIQVKLYKWEEGELVVECSYSDTILAVFVKCKGDFILVR